MRNSAHVKNTTPQEAAAGQIIKPNFAPPHLAEARNLLNTLFPNETKGAVQFYIGENDSP